MNPKEIIQECIDVLTEERELKQNQAAHEANHDRYMAAGEFQTIATGLSLGIERLEEKKRTTR